MKEYQELGDTMWKRELSKILPNSSSSAYTYNIYRKLHFSLWTHFTSSWKENNVYLKMDELNMIFFQHIFALHNIQYIDWLFSVSNLKLFQFKFSLCDTACTLYGSTHVKWYGKDENRNFFVFFPSNNK